MRARTNRSGAADENEAWVQLATRIPKTLHRSVRLHCVEVEMSIMEFVIAAIERKLQRDGKRRG